MEGKTKAELEIGRMEIRKQVQEDMKIWADYDNATLKENKPNKKGLFDKIISFFKGE